MTGLSRGTIANIEVGKANPRKVSLMLIAYATGVDLHWLETGEPPVEDDVTEDAA
jgi:Helix-turn-helix.